MGWVEIATAYILGVASSLTGQWFWQKRVSPTWEHEITTKDTEFWGKLGYVKNEDNQRVHKKRGPIANNKQVSAENLPTQLAKGYRHVRTKFLRKKVFCWVGSPSRKDYFLEPDPKSLHG